jgi:hypothetical protein
MRSKCGAVVDGEGGGHVNDPVEQFGVFHFRHRVPAALELGAREALPGAQRRHFESGNGEISRHASPL